MRKNDRYGIVIPVTYLSVLQVAPERFDQELKKAAKLCNVTRTKFLKILNEYQPI